MDYDFMGYYVDLYQFCGLFELGFIFVWISMDFYEALFVLLKDLWFGWLIYWLLWQLIQIIVFICEDGVALYSKKFEYGTCKLLFSRNYSEEDQS